MGQLIRLILTGMVNVVGWGLSQVGSTVGLTYGDRSSELVNSTASAPVDTEHNEVGVLQMIAEWFDCVANRDRFKQRAWNAYAAPNNYRLC